MRLPTARDGMLRQAFAILEREDVQNQKINRDITVSGRDLYLYSPSGQAWNLVVSETGALGVQAVFAPAAAALTFTGYAPTVATT